MSFNQSLKGLTIAMIIYGILHSGFLKPYIKDSDWVQFYLVTFRAMLPIQFGFTAYHSGQTFYPKKVLYVGDTSYFENEPIEVVAYNQGWTEGAVWNPQEKALYYSDVMNDMIYRWTEEFGEEVFLQKSGGHDPLTFTTTYTKNIPDYHKKHLPGSSGLALHNGWLYICQHGSGQIVKTKLEDVKKGSFLYENQFHVVAKSFQGKRFNSPNDLVIDKENGDVWFTDPTYGWDYLPKFDSETIKSERCGGKCTPHRGVYRIKAGTTEAELISDLQDQPNGIGFSPDGKILYVSDSTVVNHGGMIAMYQNPKSSEIVLPLVRKNVFINKLSLLDRIPVVLFDGFKVDEKGLIWTSNLEGIAIIDPENQRYIARVYLGVGISTIEFGDNGDVFILGGGYVFRMKRNRFK